jgi:hypothetical protein
LLPVMISALSTFWVLFILPLLSSGLIDDTP